ncbi:MAG: hypothetical protein L6R42_006268, partial [Xanthoria sp. 1 TBL-2021]
MERSIPRMVNPLPSLTPPPPSPLTSPRFYVNLHTKVSQWDLPTQPAYPSSDAPPPGGPPGYSGPGVAHPEKDPYSNIPYSGTHAPGAGQNESDAVLAARLQAEEDERARVAGGGRPTSRGAADQYYGQPQQPGYPGGPGMMGQQQPQPPGYVGGYPGAPDSNQSYDQQQLPPREQKSKGLGGLLSKLSGKASGGSSHGGGYPQQHGYGGGGYPQQQGYGGGYGGGGYGAPHKKPGMGVGGAAALGAGGGLLGGAMLA